MLLGLQRGFGRHCWCPLAAWPQRAGGKCSWCECWHGAHALPRHKLLYETSSNGKSIRVF